MIRSKPKKPRVWGTSIPPGGKVTPRIYEDQDGYSIASHVLLELVNCKSPNGLKAKALNDLVLNQPNGHRMGAYLRDMKVRGLVFSYVKSPKSTYVRWKITEDGRKYLEEHPIT